MPLRVARGDFVWDSLLISVRKAKRCMKISQKVVAKQLKEVAVLHLT